jgi:ureidoacrylate peracid hydrolase
VIGSPVRAVLALAGDRRSDFANSSEVVESIDRPGRHVDISPDLVGSSALLVVDMQNGFCHADGSVARRFDISGYRAPIPFVAALVTAAHDAAIPVVWSRQEHREDDAGRLGHRVPNHTSKLGYVPCLEGTWDAEILDELEPLVGDDDLVITKPRASCFYATTLEDDLRALGVDTLVVAGVATNYCVDATVRDAYARDFDLLIVRDACGSTWPDLHEATLRNSELFHGAVVATEAVVSAMAAIGSPTHEGGST